MKSPLTKKYTLVIPASQPANQKLQESIFFSRPNSIIKFFSPPLQKKIKSPNRIVLTRTDIALNVNRFGQSECKLDTAHLRTDSTAADNIKIKRNNFFEGFIGYQTFLLLMKCVQVQKMRTTLWHKFFFYLFAFFAESVSLLIPQKNYFVNPFFVEPQQKRPKNGCGFIWLHFFY
jgi:hypothetical protein